MKSGAPDGWHFGPVEGEELVKGRQTHASIDAFWRPESPRRDSHTFLHKARSKRGLLIAVTPGRKHFRFKNLALQECVSLSLQKPQPFAMGICLRDIVLRYLHTCVESRPMPCPMCDFQAQS